MGKSQTTKTKKPAFRGGLQEGWRGIDALTAGPRVAGIVIAVIGVVGGARHRHRRTGGDERSKGVLRVHGPSVRLLCAQMQAG